jgi:hypothetical protein
MVFAVAVQDAIRIELEYTCLPMASAKAAGKPE